MSCPRRLGLRCTICPLNQCLKENSVARNDDWRDQANCLGLDVNDFVPSGKNGTGPIPNELWRVCTRCPVIQECFDFAMENHVDGYWAGSSANQRQRAKPGDKAPALRRCECGRPPERRQAVRCDRCASRRALRLERERQRRLRERNQAA